MCSLGYYTVFIHFFLVSMIGHHFQNMNVMLNLLNIPFCVHLDFIMPKSEQERDREGRVVWGRKGAGNGISINIKS